MERDSKVKEKHISNAFYHVGRIRHNYVREPGESLDQYIDRTWKMAIEAVARDEREKPTLTVSEELKHSKQTKLNRQKRKYATLIEMMYQYPDKSASDVLELWKQELQSSADRQVETVRAMNAASPSMYGLIKMGVIVDGDAGGAYREKLAPIERYRILEQDIKLFAKEHGINEKELWAVLEGRQLETGVWRAYDGRNLSSKIYIDRSELVKQRQELREEDEKEAVAKAERDELQRRAVTSISHVPVDYIPGKGRK